MALRWKYSSTTRGDGFEPRTVQTVGCMNMPVCIGSGYFMYNTYEYIFTKKVNIYVSICIRYLESITQALQALTLDKIIVSVNV
jgi:hypothetical protein